MQKIVLSMACFLSVFTSLAGHAESYPRGLSTDSRVKVVMYDPNNVVRINGRYGYQTDIVFAPNETVQNVSIGDSLAWQAVPVGHHLFIKPVTSSSTNMTVLTNTHSYNFQIDSTRLRVSPTYQLQFIYSDASDVSEGNDTVSGTFDPDKLNWKYSYTGSKSVVPAAAFDNGQFTYFKFKPGQKHPAIFSVDGHRQETLINYHVQGEYVVVNSTAPQFTLREGASVACIYNDAAIGDWASVRSA